MRLATILGVLLSLIVLGLGGVYFVSLSQPLLSPADQTFKIDLSTRLQTRISRGAELSSVSEKLLDSLGDKVPRYLSYESTTGKVFAAHNATVSFAPASFTKLLSAQVALDLLRIDQTIRVYHEATLKEPTTLGIKQGEQFLVGELLRASIATSANDAATNLALASASLNGLDLSAFFSLMNQKALYIGMSNSRFASADGLDAPGQQTTLVDLAKLIHNSLASYPEIIAAAASDREDILPNNLHGKYYVSNWNGLLKVYPGVYGLKIAYTGDAGYGTIVVANRSGKQVVAIVSGTDSIPARDLAAAALLDAGFIAQGLPPARINRDRLRPRYKEWSDLIKQTKAELAAQQNQP